ncbi:MAG: ABC transporter ATP-binding protein [Pseudomonadota bacterium]
MRGLSLELRQEAPIPLDIALTCAPGELLALVGPSGCGKSTILRSIAGLYRPRVAKVAVDDEIWTDTSAGIRVATWMRHVGMVFQSYGLFPHMSAIGNVEAALATPDPAERRRRAAALLDQVNLGGLEQRRPDQLSGGQQQRVAVARALAREPKVLLLDEPFSAVDKLTRGRLYEELAGMRRSLAMPILLVTHDLDEALMLADRLCLVQRGRILQQGRPLDVVNRPTTPEAARVVGHRNIFPARVAGHRLDPPATLLDWRGRRIEAALQPAWSVGAEVSWLIPPSKVVLHRRDRPSRGEAENPVAGTISSFVALGDTTISAIVLDGGEPRRLTLHVARHAAERNGLAAGVRISVSLLAEAIHVMPAQRPRYRRDEVPR